MRKAKPKRKIGPLRWLSVGNIAFLCWITYMANRVQESTPFGTFLTYLPQPIFLIPSTVLVLLSLFMMRLRWVGANLVVFLFGGWILLNPRLIPMRPLHAGQELRVLTYNVHHGESSSWDSVRHVIESESPDIFCLQEANGDLGKRKGAASPLQNRFRGYQVVVSREFVIGSRWPISSQESGTQVPWLTVITHGVTVATTHLQSFPNPSTMVRTTNALPDRFAKTAAFHEHQVDVLIKRFGEKRRLVLCGDFNTPAKGQIYRRLGRRFHDAFDASVGLGYTHPSVLPLQRIDYVWTTGLEAESVKVPSTTASDHRPVVATLLIPK